MRDVLRCVESWRDRGLRVFFRHSASLAFAPSDIESVEHASGTVTVTTTFAGVTGTQKLVHDILLEAAERTTLALPLLWLEAAHHRAFEGFIEAMLAARHAIPLAWLDALTSDATGLSLPERRRIAPWLVTSRRSARGCLESLRATLEHAIGPGLDIRLDCRAGGRIELDPSDRCALGVRATSLGTDARLGDTDLDGEGTIVVSIRGAPGWAMDDLRREGRLHGLILAVVRAFDRDLTKVRVRVEGATSPLQLGGSRLGQTLGRAFTHEVPAR